MLFYLFSKTKYLSNELMVSRDASQPTREVYKGHSNKMLDKYHKWTTIQIKKTVCVLELDVDKTCNHVSSFETEVSSTWHLMIGRFELGWRTNNVPKGTRREEE